MTYRTMLDELNIIGLLSEDIDDLIDNTLSYLINAYTTGWNSVCTALKRDVPISVDDMDTVIYFMIEGETFEDRLRNQYPDPYGIERIVDTEFHRVYNTAAQNAAEKIKRQTGKDYTKTWVTMLDDKVRDTHAYLEGMSIPIEKAFFTYDGDSAMYPGGFFLPENNINCRCILTYAEGTA